MAVFLTKFVYLYQLMFQELENNYFPKIFKIIFQIDKDSFDNNGENSSSNRLMDLKLSPKKDMKNYEKGPFFRSFRL